MCVVGNTSKRNAQVKTLKHQDGLPGIAAKYQHGLLERFTLTLQHLLAHGSHFRLFLVHKNSPGSQREKVYVYVFSKQIHAWATGCVGV